MSDQAHTDPFLSSELSERLRSLRDRLGELRGRL
jgi:hypothetical protein